MTYPSRVGRVTFCTCFYTHIGLGCVDASLPCIIHDVRWIALQMQCESNVVRKCLAKSTRACGWTRSGSARLGAQISPPQTLKVSGITPPMRTHDYSNDLNSSGTAAPASTCGSSASASPAFLHGLLRIAHVEKFDLLKVSIRP